MSAGLLWFMGSDVLSVRSAARSCDTCRFRHGALDGLRPFACKQLKSLRKGHHPAQCVGRRCGSGSSAGWRCTPTAASSTSVARQPRLITAALVAADGRVLTVRRPDRRRSGGTTRRPRRRRSLQTYVSRLRRHVGCRVAGVGGAGLPVAGRTPRRRRLAVRGPGRPRAGRRSRPATRSAPATLLLTADGLWRGAAAAGGDATSTQFRGAGEPARGAASGGRRGSRSRPSC